MTAALIAKLVGRWIVKNWRIVLAALIIAVVAWQIHAYGSRRFEAGAQSVQVKWDAENVREAQAARDQAIKVAAREDAARARNEEIAHDYKAQLAAIAADRDRLSSRLHNAEGRARALSEAANQPRADGTGAQPGSPRSFNEFLDAYDAACRADAAQLDALNAELKGQ